LSVMVEGRWDAGYTELGGRGYGFFGG
jgi:hypothetical protein